MTSRFGPGRLTPAGESGQEVVVSLVPLPDEFLALLDSLLHLRVTIVDEREQLQKFEEALVVDLLPTFKRVLQILLLFLGELVVELADFSHGLPPFVGLRRAAFQPTCRECQPREMLGEPDEVSNGLPEIL